MKIRHKLETGAPVSIGVVGATGAVGESLLEVLSDLVLHGESSFPGKSLNKALGAVFQKSHVRAFASSRSRGRSVSFGMNRQISCEEIGLDKLTELDVALFATEAEVSREFATQLAQAGVLCVDNSSAFRQDADVCLCVPEVNSSQLLECLGQNPPVIANPNCVAAPLSLVLSLLQNAVDSSVNSLLNVVVSTYQGVSGSGRAGVQALVDETRTWMEGAHSGSMDLKWEEDESGALEGSVYPKPIAFNVLPFVANLDEKGHTDEETKIIAETRKILSTPSLGLSATSVRVPVFIGHSLSVTAQWSQPVDMSQLSKALEMHPSIDFCRDVTRFATPREYQGDTRVSVSRFRRSTAFEPDCGVSFWIVSDNLRKGASSNVVQVLETVLQSCLSVGQ